MTGEVRVLGIDGGFASIGLALVVARWSPDGMFDDLELRRVTVLRTKKSKIARSVTSDDASRMEEIANAISSIFFAWEPCAIACEAFAPNMRQGGGGSSAWKTLLTIGIARGIAQERGVPFSLRRPAELSRLLPKRVPKGDQKAAVEAVACRRIRQAKKQVEASINRSLREHAYDAIGHALLELDRREVIMGGLFRGRA